MNIEVFSGTVAYTNKRIAELRRYGYVVIWSKLWSDGKYTYKMEKVDVQSNV